MKMSNMKPGLRRLPPLWAIGLLAVVGCGGPKIVPVSGKVTLDGKPHSFSQCFVSFNPDPAKGHTARVACIGRINENGTYELTTDDGSKVKKGAIVGWYKVTIDSTASDGKPPPVNKKFTDFNKTDLLIEVVPDAPPGAYDLNFTK
jgi:hypothetical protein